MFKMSDKYEEEGFHRKLQGSSGVGILGTLERTGMQYRDSHKNGATHNDKRNHRFEDRLSILCVFMLSASYRPQNTMTSNVCKMMDSLTYTIRARSVFEKGWYSNKSTIHQTSVNTNDPANKNQVANGRQRASTSKRVWQPPLLTNGLARVPLASSLAWAPSPARDIIPIPIPTLFHAGAAAPARDTIPVPLQF